MTPILSVTYLYLFWVLYILVMGVYRAHLSKRLRGVAKLLAFPIVILGAFVDLATNLTLACVIFLDLPREALVTQRLTRYKNTETGWRYTLACWVCEGLLDPFDPTGDHC